MIGYGGDFNLITRDDAYWNLASGTDSTKLKDYMKAAQYKFSTTETDSRGTNFIRVFAMGGSCNNTHGPGAGCTGYFGIPEIMPFKSSGGKYSLEAFKTSGTGDALDTKKWTKRLLNFIKHANENGIAVMISLFDENTLTGHTKWGNNPWNPVWNDTTCSVSTDPDNALPGFYKINTNSCLRDTQKNYVLSILNTIRNNKVCKNGTRCKNVIIELMNEAALVSGTAEADFESWHTKAATWVKGKGYLTAASVKGEGVNEFSNLNACTSTSCPNYYNIFYLKDSTFHPARPYIDIVSLHYGVWENNICGRDDKALIFGKPVIFDDDGGPLSGTGSRNNNRNLEIWAENVSSGVGPPQCNQDTGKLHFYHTGDATELEGAPAPYAPVNCQVNESAAQPPVPSKFVDCYAWNTLADGLPKMLCGAACEETRIDYCENHNSGDIDCDDNLQVNNH